MSRIVKIKNNTGSDKIWCGQTVLANEYYQLQEIEKASFASSSNLLMDISNEEAIINDGDHDILNINDAINYLKGTIGYYDALDYKQNVHDTPRPKGTVTLFTSTGDGTSSNNAIGGGSSLVIKHAISDDTTQSVVAYFNTIENRTYVHEGYAQFKDALWDKMDVIVVPKVTAITAGTGYRNYNNYLLVPEILGVDYGSQCNVDGDIHLVEVTRDQPEHENRIGWWDADYDTSTHTFSNITPNLNGKGQFNIFSYQVNLFHFVYDFALNGTTSGPFILTTHDVERIGHNTGFKFQIKTEGDDHAWSASIMLNLFRENIAF